MDDKRKNRWLICLFLILILAILLMAGWNQKKQRAMAASMTVETYTIAPGDTLWRIAKKRVGQGKDPREMIYDIEKLNNITPDIIPGQKIKIPMEGK